MLGDDRVTSGFGISIGTGIALETIFTPTAEVYDPSREVIKEDISNYNIFIVNYYTIIRNIISSLSAKDKARVSDSNKIKEISEIAEYEIRAIEMLTLDKNIEFILLSPDYYKIKGFEFLDKSKPTMNNVSFNVAYRSLPKNKKSLFEITNRRDKILILSHIAMDLIYNDSRKITLLESNTGKVITKYLFNKKYRKSAYDYNKLPMTKELLSILGDSSNILKAKKPGFKKGLIEFLNSKKITPMSSHKIVKELITKYQKKLNLVI